jgi:hypothetical protein
VPEQKYAEIVPPHLLQSRPEMRGNLRNLGWENCECLNATSLLSGMFQGRLPASCEIARAGPLNLGLRLRG